MWAVGASLLPPNHSPDGYGGRVLNRAGFEVWGLLLFFQSRIDPLALEESGDTKMALPHLTRNPVPAPFLA
jgi:hypothetical protein